MMLWTAPPPPLGQTLFATPDVRPHLRGSGIRVLLRIATTPASDRKYEVTASTTSSSASIGGATVRLAAAKGVMTPSSVANASATISSSVAI